MLHSFHLTRTCIHSEMFIWSWMEKEAKLNQGERLLACLLAV